MGWCILRLRFFLIYQQFRVLESVGGFLRLRVFRKIASIRFRELDFILLSKIPKELSISFWPRNYYDFFRIWLRKFWDFKLLSSFSLCDVPMDVPQGSVLGALLLSMFINDLPTVLQSSIAHLYDDDFQIYSPGTFTTFFQQFLHSKSWTRCKLSLDC